MNETTVRQAKKLSSAVTLDNGKAVEPKNGGRPKGRPIAEDHATWDQAEGRSRQILAAIMAFRDGNFSIRLPTDWAGTDGRIAEAFNQAIGHEDRIAQEVTRLSVTVGKEGRLRQRMSLPGAIGG